ncbi:MAG: Lsr2 family protein, partial [Cellulomonas sp.]|nr:Lsr2 family protein [Cellulomonas sp.]
MAQKVQVLLVDDLDGGTADETVTFALDGISYEIDLTTENAAK